MGTLIARSLLLFAFVLLLLPAIPTRAAGEQRLALVIGNNQYDTGRLKNPVNDATDMAAALQRLGFTVVLKKNARQREMEEAIQDFGNRLKRGGVGLFYYAGHGIQVNGVNYLIPIKAAINKESDVKYEAVDANRVLDEMGNANNGLNIVILDACRDNPFARSFRNAGRGLAIVSTAPAGTFISYSTGPGQVARDGAGRNSPYTAALLQYMREPGLPIEDVFKGVRQKLRKETGQVPWELSSLEGRFYFRSGTATVASPAAGPGSDSFAEQKDADEGKELLRQKAALEEERRKLEEEKKQLAMARPPASPVAKEIGRDGRFIAYSDGTVLDTKTNLMWAAKDNGKGVGWHEAKAYCEHYRGGGHTDWRLPNGRELASLYDPGKKDIPGARVSDLIKISTTHGWTWEVSDEGDRAAAFNFSEGRFGTGIPKSYDQYRALPVRSAK